MAALTLMAVAAQMTAANPGEVPRQAKTPAEFDLFLDFDQATDPEVRHQAAARFEAVYPQSELLVYVYQSELEYARARNRYQDAVSAGEKALKVAPDDIPVLLTLAEVLPTGPADAGALEQAETYANQVLAIHKTRLVSPELSLDDCEQLRRVIRSRAHAALAVIGSKRGDLSLATRELEIAVAENPARDSVQLYRLGKLYAVSGRRPSAAALFQQVVQLGPAEIAKLAAAELSKER